MRLISNWRESQLGKGLPNDDGPRATSRNTSQLQDIIVQIINSSESSKLFIPAEAKIKPMKEDQKCSPMSSFGRSEAV